MRDPWSFFVCLHNSKVLLTAASCHPVGQKTKVNEDSFSSGITQVTTLLIWRPGHREDAAWGVSEFPQCSLWLQTGSFHPGIRICREKPLSLPPLLWHGPTACWRAAVGSRSPPAKSQDSLTKFGSYDFFSRWLKVVTAQVSKKNIQTNFWYFLACYAIKQWREGKKKNL